MSAADLIRLAGEKGYGVGRVRPGLYYYGREEGGRYVERRFAGAWGAFVRLVRSL